MSTESDYFLVKDGRDRSWMPLAACRGLDPKERDRIFFSGRGQYSDVAEAKALCSTCVVASSCLDYGMTEKFGVWGGRSERERRRLRPAWKRRQDRGAA